QLLDRGIFDGGIRILVADQPRRKLQAFAIAQRHPHLLNQHHIAVILRKDDDGVDTAAALDIFPRPVADDADIFALPLDLTGHSSISLSGISLVSVLLLGKCSASTSPIRSTAATIPSPGRPAFTSVISAAIASPQVSGVVTAVIASSPMISARCSPIDRYIRMPVRPIVRRSPPVLNSITALRRTRRVLVEPGVSNKRSGIHFRMNSTARN